MKALLSIIGELPHGGARGAFVRLGIDRPDDGEVHGFAGVAVEHETVGFLGDAAAYEGAAADLAAQIAPPLGLLVAEADRLHRHPEAACEIAMSRHLRVSRQHVGVDIRDDPFRQQLVLGRAPAVSKAWDATP